MEYGVTFPQTAVGTDPADVASFASTAEELGYRHVQAYDHVLGANPETQDFRGIFDYTDQFHEPLTLFSYLAGATDRIELLPGVLVLPMRQTALVAKQTAEVDVLSEGRLRLGVGVGSNRVEYEGLGTSMTNRGARVEEQIELLRRLWENELVDFDGRWHRIPDAGINPRPVQQPVPLWIGGGADVVLERAARLGDGWIAMSRETDAVAAKLDRLRSYCEDEGRAFDELELVCALHLDSRDPAQWIERVERYQALGITRASVATAGLDLPDPTAHETVIEEFREAIEDAGLVE